MAVEAPPAPTTAAPPIATPTSTATRARPAAPAAKPEPPKGGTPNPESGKPPGARKPQPVSKPSANLNDAFAQLDKLGQPVEDEGQGASGKGPETKAVPETETTKQPEGTKTDTAKTDKTPEAPETKTPEGLRKAYEETKSKLAAMEQELTTLKSKPAEDPEKVKLSETLKQREERLAKLEEEIRYTNYEKSDEYQEKYWKPYVKAYGAAQTQMGNFDVTAEDGTVRAATGEDFNHIAAMDYRAAKAKAKEQFGDDWQAVMDLRQKVHDLNGTRLEALDTYRKEGGEREKQRVEQTAKQQKEMGAAWVSENQAAEERFPQWSKPVEGDEKGNALLVKGKELADSAFSGVMRDGETGQFRKLTPQEKLKVDSAVRNKAAWFDRVAVQNGELLAKVKEYETKLKEYEKSEPGAGDGKGGKAPTGAPTLESIMGGLDRFVT